jgi:hypothetical protein
LPIIVALSTNTYFSYLSYKSTSRLQTEKTSQNLTVENKKTYNSIMIQKNQFIINQQGKLNFYYFIGWNELYEATNSKNNKNVKVILEKIENDFLTYWNI